MKPLYEARDRIEAQLLKDYLAARHIQTIIQGEYLSGAAGELPAMQFPVIWVLEDRDYARGRELVEECLAEQQAGAAWYCRRCGERSEGQFQACWNCGASRPE
jgi:hypothetical protein